MWAIAVAAFLAAALVWAEPSRVGCGPAQAGCGPAAVVGGATLPSVIIPATVGADTNCAASGLPVSGQASANAWVGYAEWGKTCPTGANATGYDVSRVTTFIVNGAATAHMKCSVYTDASPNVHVAAGCDTVQTTFGASNPNAWFTMATTGACHLASATRYWIACATDDTNTMYGQPTTACATCWVYASGQAYATLWPATLTSTGSYNLTVSAYLTATASP